MAWQTEMVGILRFMVGDVDTPYKYTDSRLQKTILVGAQRVISETRGRLRQQYSSVFDTDYLYPDPTVGTRDESFITLTLLAAACFVDQTELRLAARRGGYVVKEFSSSIDTKGVTEAALNIANNGWCKNYADEMFKYWAYDNYLGVAILSPFRTLYTAYTDARSLAGIYYNNELFGG